eukprot:5906476-Karenia_brevis.AAC.1
MGLIGASAYARLSQVHEPKCLAKATWDGAVGPHVLTSSSSVTMRGDPIDGLADGCGNSLP